MFKTYRFSFLFVALIGLSACARGFQADPTQAAANIESTVCNASMKTSVFDELNRMADEQQGYPSAQGLHQALATRLQQHWGNTLSRTQDEALDAASDDIASVYEDVLNEAQAMPAKDGQDLHQAMLIALAALELGDSSTRSRARLQSGMDTKLAHARAAVEQVDSSCGAAAVKPVATPVPNTQTLLGQWQATQAKPVYGAWKTMATAYQSCDVVGMEPMTRKTPNLQGIKQILQSNGNYYRKFTNLSEFISTNPYYKGYRAPASSCVQVEKSPLVYDFGGKPYVATSKSPLNLFKEAGSGTPNVLGIDCSGFVSSAMLTAGLRLQSGTALRPSHVGYYAARDYKSPKSSGMSCLKPISLSKAQSIVPGDILASSGHVVMVDRVGSDPFGVSKFTSASQCTTTNVSYTKFDFTIIQSSPVKNSIGIDRIEASSFFGGTEVSMRQALEKYAIAACKARFTTATTTPSFTEATLVRHTGTAACLESANIELTSQECVSSCPAVQ